MILLNRFIGNKGELGLLMYKFNPDNIRCRGPSQPLVQHCLAILRDMPATDEYTIFGKKGDPNVDVGLPHQVLPNDESKSA